MAYISFEEVKEMFKKSIDETTNANEALEKTVQLIYLKGYEQGQRQVIDELRAEIEQIEINGHIKDVECFRAGIDTAFNIITKYKAESEDKE